MKNFIIFLSIKMSGTLGKMIAKHNHSVTPCGEDFGCMKSALQKYIRRGERDKALRCVFEIDCFNYLDDRTAKANITNMLHRLQIIFLEDIGVVGLSMLPTLYKCFNVIYNNRDKRNKVDMFTNSWCNYRKIEIDSLTIITLLLSASKKGRQGSHYKSVYGVDLDYRLLNHHKWLHEIEKRKSESVPLIELPIVDGEETIISNAAKHLLYNLRKSDHMAVYWAWVIFKSSPVKKYYKKSKSGFLIFTILFSFVEEIKDTKDKDYYKEILQICMDWYNNDLSGVDEQFLCWEIPLIAILEKRKPTAFNIPIINDIENAEKIYSLALEGEECVIDDYCYDMHTKKGKGKLYPYITFAKEGSLVTNEDELINKDYLMIYMQYKYLQDKKTLDDYYKDFPLSQPIVSLSQPKLSITQPKLIPQKNKGEKESDRYDILVRAQLVTGNAKTDSYYAVVKGEEKKVVFVKGPYLSSEPVLLNIGINKIKKILPGCNPIESQLIECIPNALTSALGMRNKFKHGQVGYFLESEDICEFTPNTIPITTRKSEKWPITPVVDWTSSNINVKGSIKPEDCKNDNISKGYCLGFMFKYIMGINDLAARNFMLNVKKELVYTVDEDVIDKEIGQLSKEVVSFLKTKWEDLKLNKVEKEWSDILIKNKDMLRKYFGENIADNIIERSKTSFINTI